MNTSAVSAITIIHESQDSVVCSEHFERPNLDHFYISRLEPKSTSMLKWSVPLDELDKIHVYKYMHRIMLSSNFSYSVRAQHANAI